MDKEPSSLNAVLTLLYQRTGYDFREYRKSTLQRRIARRVHASGCPTETSYLDYLLNHPEEEIKLLGDLTVRVTEFFREPESWDVVASKVIPALGEEAKKQEARSKEIKIWSAGCATGEEAYSLAILLASCFSASCFFASILGTDLDEDSLAQAGKGVYSAEKIKLVPSPIREKYFHLTPNEYQVLPQIKERVTFRRHDLVSEAISESFDLIVCRNVLIYFSKELQEKVLLKFHQALRPGGFLWLGKAESLWGKPQKLFECMDKGGKIFRRQFIAFSLE